MAARVQSNFRYISGAVFIHALVIGLFIAASLYSRQTVVPHLGIQARLVDRDSLNPTKPAPDPKLQEQEKIEKQKQEQLEQQREKEKQEKEAQLQAEQQSKEREAEQKRIVEAQQEAQRQKQAAEQKRVEEIKQKLREVEQKRQNEIDAKERVRREAELKAQLADEEGRDQAVNAGLLNQYAALIRQRVERNWIKPPSAQSGIKCEVRVTQAVGGMVLSVAFGKCNADAAVRQSIESAVMRSSPLPPPGDSRLFDRNLSFIFNPAE